MNVVAIGGRWSTIPRIREAVTNGELRGVGGGDGR